MLGEGTLLFPLVAGALSFVSPCIVPMITVYLTLITGMTMEELTREQNNAAARRSIFLNTLLFVLGFGLVFTLAGGTANFLVKGLFSDYTDLLNKVGGVMVIALGLHLAGVFRLGFMDRLPMMSRFPGEKKPLGFAGAFLVGLFFAVACSHCIAPLLYSTLIYAATTESPETGMATMAAFSAGLAAPYLITALAISPVLGSLRAINRRMRLVSGVSGSLLVAFGGLMLIGKFTLLAELFSRILPYRVPGAM